MEKKMMLYMKGLKYNLDKFAANSLTAGRNAEIDFTTPEKVFAMTAVQMKTDSAKMVASSTINCIISDAVGLMENLRKVSDEYSILISAAYSSKDMSEFDYQMFDTGKEVEIEPLTYDAKEEIYNKLWVSKFFADMEA